VNLEHCLLCPASLLCVGGVLFTVGACQRCGVIVGPVDAAPKHFLPSLINAHHGTWSVGATVSTTIIACINTPERGWHNPDNQPGRYQTIWGLCEKCYGKYL
jgi:hypothetical protein